MTLESTLPLPVVLPIVGAAVSPLVGRAHRRLPLYVGMAAMAGALAVLIGVSARVYSGHGRIVVHFLSNEKPQHGRVLGITFAADPFGVTFAMLVVAVGLLLFLSLLSEYGDLGKKELGGLAALVQLLIAALIGSGLTADLVNLFVWFEVAALASYGLTGFFLERPIALEAAFKNLVLTSAAGFLVFAGAGMLYSTTGALNLGQLHAATPLHPPRAVLLAVALVIAGFATKAGIAPFHGWLPDAHTPVPGAVSALFSALMVGLGIVALARVTLLIFPELPHLAVLLTVLGIASAILGAALALVQDDLKRLLAWDTVSQTGILVAGFASRTSAGVAGAVYHLVNHALFKTLLFLCAGAVVHATGITVLSQMGGLTRRRPLLTTGFIVGSAAIAGLPPLNGYASLGLIHEGLKHEPVAYAGALLAQILTVAALGRAAWLGFLRRRHEAYERLEPSHAGMRISLIVLAAGCVLFGLGAVVFVRDVAAPAAGVLLHPDAYGSAVLGSGGPVPLLPVEFGYADPTTMGTAAAEIVLGLLLAVMVVRRGTGRVLEPLRGMHTGSVNDHAALQVTGLALVALVLFI